MQPQPGQKTIIITGCSSGIGAYCARELRNDGWFVVASARQPGDLAKLEQDGITAHYLDYAKQESVDTFFQQALTSCNGRIDALFNNGAYSQAGAVEDLPVEALRAQFEANLFGWHDLTRRVVPVMRHQGHGRIVQCSSVLALVPYRWRGAYNASKCALEALSLTMALELADENIKISLIEPGPITSKIAQNALPHFLNNIDIENSPHRTAYEKQLHRLQGKAKPMPGKLEPDAVYAVLKHALTSDKPRFHYPVTRQAKIATIARRLFPARMLYGWLAKQD